MADGDDPNRAISVFCSYSHKDAELRNELADHLVPLERAGLIDVWHDRKIPPGAEWEDAIDWHLASSDIVLLLVSASFIASPFCWHKEMTTALARHARGEARVIPVILQPCLWQESPFAGLQAVPKDGKAVTKWRNRQDAYLDIAKGIRMAAKELRSKRAPTARAEAAAPVEPAPASLAAATVWEEEQAPAKTATKPELAAVVIGKPIGARIVQDVGVDPRKQPNFAVFKDVDAPWCPEMVVIPAGTFLMGSPPGEKGREDDEGPQHCVTIGYRFGIGRYPVTVGEYRHFVEATDRCHRGGMFVWTGSGWEHDNAKTWRDPGFAQSDLHPVVGVTWDDAQAYVEWLSHVTSKIYRLPSEAEWEYACRAGTTTHYSFGVEITNTQANHAMKVGRTTEVGAYPPNPWGLGDMHGNVFEWVKDALHDSYQGAPLDGRAWVDHAGAGRVFRGGAWNVSQPFLRSACRGGSIPLLRGAYLGFRLARGLEA